MGQRCAQLDKEFSEMQHTKVEELMKATRVGRIRVSLRSVRKDVHQES